MHWVPARELVYFGHEQRPYAKYVGDGDRSIHGIFTDGHPSSWKNSLHYLRYEAGDLYAVGGRRLGTLSHVPLHTSKLDHVYHYSDRGGRAWPHDIALTAEGRPRIVYTRRVANRDTFYYALPRRHALGEPQDRRGRRGPPVLPLRRRDARPRGPALRLPVAHDRPLEPGRAVVHARRRPHLDAPPAHRRPRRLRHPPGHAARAHERQPDHLRLGRRAHARLTDYTTRVHALDF